MPPDVTPTKWAWVENTWLVPFGLMGTHLLLRLPDGHLPSPRWRWVSRPATVAIVAGVVVFPAQYATNTPTWQGALSVLLLLLLAGCIIASVASLVVRARRAGADEKHQIRWIAAGGLAFLVSWLLALVPGFFGASDTSTINNIFDTFALVMYSCVPIGIGIAILRYRLYDIDVVLRKAVILGDARRVLHGRVRADRRRRDRRRRVALDVGALVRRGGVSSRSGSSRC